METLHVLSGLLSMIAIIVGIAVGRLLATWLRISNGHPLDDAWDQALQGRLETIEHIFTGAPNCLAREIVRLQIGSAQMALRGARRSGEMIA